MEKVDLECVGCSNDQKYEQHNPEYKNKGLWMGITILEFCHLTVERKTISGINGRMRSRLLGVGLGRDRK